MMLIVKNTYRPLLMNDCLHLGMSDSHGGR
jgi:hypothetical protein